MRDPQIMTRIARFIAWLFGTAGAQPVPVAPIEAKQPMSIHPNALWEASRTGRRVPTAHEVFARPRPLPGTLPANMAMDDCLPANIAGDWGTQSIYESLMHEGLRFEGYPYLAQLAQRAEYRMIAEKWAEHSTRKWIKITGKDERVAKIVAELDRLEVRDKFKEAAEQDGLFGRSQVFLDFDDADDDAELAASLPVDPAKIGTKRPLKRLKVVEPMWSYPGPYNTRNPLDARFYRPSTWYIYGKTVHDTRLLTLVGREVPDMLKPAYAFGGLSMTQMAKPYVDNWLRTRQSVADMVHAFSVMVLKTDTDGLLQGELADNLWARADVFNQCRDNRGLFIIDKAAEEFENVAVPISGLDKLQAQAQEQLSSVSGIPLVILLGVTPSGLNASSDGEVRSFYAAVKAYQNKVFRPALAKLLDIVQLSLFGDIDQGIKFEFEDLWEMSDKDKADIRKSDAEADVGYINAGVIDPEEARERLRNDETSLYHGVDLSGPAPEVPDDASEGDPAELFTQMDKAANDGVPVRAAGVMCVAPDGRMLFLKRSASARDHAGEWCFPGGGIDYGEDAYEAALRELREETGFDDVMLGNAIDQRDGFATFRADVSEQFDVTLNDEHSAAIWEYPERVPGMLHPGVEATLARLEDEPDRRAA